MPTLERHLGGKSHSIKPLVENSRPSFSPAQTKKGSAVKIKAKFNSNRFITEKKPTVSA